MMKKGTLFAVWTLAAILLGGCGTESGHVAPKGENAVQKAMQEQMEKESDTEEKESAIEETDGDSGEETGTLVGEEAAMTEEVDIDLTTMGPDMVYATVYQLMVDPDTYAGKKIRMKGFYYAAYYEPTDTYYHYGVIQDALACCQQGLEFVWGDGSHVYPDEYPAEETEIYVTGTFETYQEEGDLNLYCHLKDAKVCWYE